MNRGSFRLNEPDVSAEDFKSEILAVNLKNGYYHSLRHAAVPIWRLLMEGRDAEEIVRCLAPFYGCAPALLAPDIDAFVDELKEGHLIVANPDLPAASSGVASEWLAGVSPVYAKPLLETYTEMQDLLLLDPIHDVDAMGWPHAAGEVKADQP
jgi:hypothetical protein